MEQLDSSTTMRKSRPRNKLRSPNSIEPSGCIERLEHNEQVVGRVFQLGVLVSVPAILDVQWMEFVARGELIELGTVRILDIVPEHGLNDEHTIPVRVEAVSRFERVAIRVKHKLLSRERADQQQQARHRQMEVCEHRSRGQKLVSRINEYGSLAVRRLQWNPGGRRSRWRVRWSFPRQLSGEPSECGWRSPG